MCIHGKKQSVLHWQPLQKNGLFVVDRFIWRRVPLYAETQKLCISNYRFSRRDWRCAFKSISTVISPADVRCSRGNVHDSRLCTRWLTRNDTLVLTNGLIQVDNGETSCSFFDSKRDVHNMRVNHQVSIGDRFREDDASTIYRFMHRPMGRTKKNRPYQRSVSGKRHWQRSLETIP